MRGITILAIAGLLQLLLILIYCIRQELLVTTRLQARVAQLATDCKSWHLDNEQLQRVYQYAKASHSTRAFIAHLKAGKLISHADTVLPDNSRGKGEVELVTGSHTQLHKSLAWQHARENVILVTWSNYHFVDFVENWAHHVRRHVRGAMYMSDCCTLAAQESADRNLPRLWAALIPHRRRGNVTRTGVRKKTTPLAVADISNYLVGAMDVQTADRLRARHINYFVMFNDTEAHSGLGSRDFGWGSGKFHLMGRQKIHLLKAFLDFGLDVVLCDSDTVWINDPTEYFQRFPAADVLTSSDHVRPTIAVGDDGLEQPAAAHSAMNIGVMFFRHSNHTKAFVIDWLHVLDEDPKMWDQNAFNMLARAGFKQDRVHTSHSRLFMAYSGRLVMGVLPIASFASGHTFHVQRLHEIMHVKPYVVHQTFQYGGTKGKRHRLREASLWLDEPSYYDVGRFLHVQLDFLPAPQDFEHLTDFNMSLFHLLNVEHQLQQLRAALALSITMNRTIIMPRLQCYCDKYWGPLHRCRLPGASKLQLPFVCPMDHVFEPFHFDDKPEAFGPPIAFREHSFLDNARTPEAIKADIAKLEVVPERGDPISDGSRLRRWRLRPNGPYGHVTDLFRDLSNRVVQLRFNAHASDGGGASLAIEPMQPAALQKAFMKRIAHIPGFWCCRSPDGPHGKGGTPYAPMISGHGIEHRP